jgi:RHS repeat-associated protein
MNQATAQGGSALLQFEGTLNEAGTVTVAGKPAMVDGTGKFIGSAAVTNGTNTVSVSARDLNGNTTTQAYEVDVTDVTGTFSYDANGNLTARGTKAYAWDAENRLIRVTSNGVELANFTYDGLGRRVSKTAGGLTNRYVYDGGDVMQDRVEGGATQRHVHGPAIDSHLATVDGAGIASYYLADHLGSIVQTTNAAQQVTLTRQYDPWGTLTIGGATSGYAFTGREWNADTGLYDYRARQYDASLGRFLTDDPLPATAREPRELNSYAYVTNNPTRFTDPLGFRATETWPQIVIKVCIKIGTAAEALLGAAIGVALMQCGDGAGCSKENKCPPCAPPAGTVGYRIDGVPPSKPHFPFEGTHVHLYIMRQDPKTCRCYWNKYMVTNPPPPPGAVPMPPTGGQ